MRFQARKDKILDRAAAAFLLPEGIRCERVKELMRDAAFSGLNIEAEIFEAAYGDPRGTEYWKSHLSEVLAIESLADLLSVHLVQRDQNIEQTQSAIISTLYAAINRFEIPPLLGVSHGEIEPSSAVKFLLSKPKREHLVPQSLRRLKRQDAEVRSIDLLE
jgi:hypothetical protein